MLYITAALETWTLWKKMTVPAVARCSGKKRGARRTLTCAQRELSRVINCTLSWRYHPNTKSPALQLVKSRRVSFAGWTPRREKEFPSRHWEDAGRRFSRLPRVFFVAACVAPTALPRKLPICHAVCEGSRLIPPRLVTIVTGKLINTSTVDSLLATKSVILVQS